MRKYHPIIDQERIAFTTVLDNGVCTIPPKMTQIVKDICDKYSRKLLYTEGNFDATRFYIEPDFTEEECEEIAKAYWAGK